MSLTRRLERAGGYEGLGIGPFQVIQAAGRGVKRFILAAPGITSSGGPAGVEIER